MAIPATTLTINYGSSSTASIPIPPGSTYDQTIRNIVIAGGVFLPAASGVITFVPFSQITSITAQ